MASTRSFDNCHAIFKKAMGNMRVKFKKINPAQDHIVQLMIRFPYLEADAEEYDTRTAEGLLSCVRLYGVVTMQYKQSSYNIPMAIFVSSNYIQRAPILFVLETSSIAIKPNHPHVGPNGMVYLPYLNQWNEHSDLVQCLGALLAVFEQKPFVYARPPVGSVGAPAMLQSVGGQVHPIETQAIPQVMGHSQQQLAAGCTPPPSAAAEAKPPALPPLPPGWEELREPSGRVFYGNPALKVVQYERPGCPPQPHNPHGGQQQQYQATAQAKPPALPPLPPGWEELSMSAGAVVFISGATGPNAAAINGPYDRTGKDSDGYSFYSKRGDPSVCIEHHDGSGTVPGYEHRFERWKVKLVSYKGKAVYMAYVAGGCALEDCTSRVWGVGNGKGFDDQPSVKMATGSEAERQVSGGCMRAHAHARDAAAPHPHA
jgi:hypothetical protein